MDDSGIPNLIPAGHPLAPLRAALPALTSVVPSPCGHESCGAGTIENIVIHLNDVVQWPREAIADWLDTLDADLRFNLPETPENTERFIL